MTMQPIIRTDFNTGDVSSALLSCLFSESSDIKLLEEPLGNFTKKKYNLFYPKLRFGIESTFKSLFVNEYIGVPTYTCSVVPHAIVLSGNKVRFYDSNKENLTTENYGDEKSYIVTPWYGSPLNNNLEHKKYAIGDFSHVNLLERKNFFNSNFYVLFFSFNSGKPISSIGGGLVSTDDKNLYLDLLQSREAQFGNIPKSYYLNELIYSYMGSLINLFNLESIKVNFDDRGYFDRLREPIDTISLGKKTSRISMFNLKLLIKHIEKYNSNNLDILKFWEEILQEFPIQLLNTEDWSNSHLNIISEKRTELNRHFKNLGIQTSFGINYLNHKTIPYKNIENSREYPNATFQSRNILQLPINLSQENFLKLRNKKTKIRKTLENLYSN